MLTHRFLAKDDLLMIHPKSPLTADDFAQLTAKVDPLIAEHGKIGGVVIDGEGFHGWKDLSGLLAHLRFVKDHHRQVQRVAAVGDGLAATVLPELARHFVDAEVKHFAAENRAEAMAWAKGEAVVHA